MKQEDKELLLKDLCARLPYGVILNIVNEDSAVAYGTFVGMTKSQKHSCLIYEDLVCIEGVLTPFRMEEVKPCLRPLSSMTEEEGREYRMFIDFSYNDFTSENTQCVCIDKINDYLDWLNSRHFDYRGLLERGLALEAPEEMYNINNNIDKNIRFNENLKFGLLEG